MTLENGTMFTGTTTHPVWIPANQQWVRLGDLEEGQRLESLSGPIAVVAIQRLADVSDVFNIEVHGHHVYRITEDGILVHNNCFEEAIAALRKGSDFKWVDNGAEMLVRRTGDTLEALQPIYTKSDDFGRMIFGLEDLARELRTKTIVVRKVGLGFGPTAGNTAKTRAMLERYGGVFEHVGDDILGPLYDITFKVQ
ncbi:MAG: Hint domain-containing protein [Rubripirellula sp.]